MLTILAAIITIIIAFILLEILNKNSDKSMELQEELVDTIQDICTETIELKSSCKYEPISIESNLISCLESNLDKINSKLDEYTLIYEKNYRQETFYKTNKGQRRHRA